MNLIYHETDSKEDLILKRTQNKTVVLPTIKDDIIVHGIDQVKINVASCCKPIPEDAIVGYITKGNGITVHRSICPNVRDVEERIIEVDWNEQITKKYPTTLLVHAASNKDVLLNIITKTANTDITLQSVNTLNTSDGFMFEITVVVPTKERLEKFMDDIRTIADIMEVERAIK